MEVRDRRSYLRPAVLVVILLLHGSLILVLLRAKPAYRARAASVLLSIFFISPEDRLALQPAETSVTPHRSRHDREHHSRPSPPVPNVNTASPLENHSSTGPPTVDWAAEAQRSAAEIAGRETSGQATGAPSASAGSTPWDLHAHFLEATGHGLKLRIPVTIPGQIIDHCFSDIDLRQTPYGPEERLQLGCALKKQPPRGDLFDSLRKPQSAK
jgi:hypothetical protein